MSNTITQPLISIIVPIYNSDKYLNQCIDSIINQTYANLEIILINDGSTDMSDAICQEYIAKDNRIIYMQQSNSGVSAARNRALDLINGYYVAFVDSDDYISPNFIKDLYEAIIGKDISICAFQRDLNKTLIPHTVGKSFALSRNDLYTYILCDNRIGGYLCNKLFSATIIKNNNLRFDKDISIGEDMAWIANYLNFALTGQYICNLNYYYRSNPTSALQNMYTTKEFDKKKVSNLDAAELIDTLTQNKTPSINSAISYRYVRTSMWLIFNMLKCNYYDKILLKRIQKTMLKNSNLLHYIFNRNSAFIEKLCSIPIALFPRTFFKLAASLFNILPDKLINKFVN